MTDKLYYATAQISDRQFMIAHTDNGLAFIDNLILAPEKLKEWFPSHRFILDLESNAKYIQALQNYVAGTKKNFDFELDMMGTVFQKEVWQALQTIPYGETRTYQDIANLIGRPKAVRAVGGAVGRNPVSLVVPCHRVIGSNGKLTGFRGGLDLKKKLLKIEGIL